MAVRQTEYLKIKGPVKYAQVWDGQIDREYEDERRGGNWSIQVKMTDDDVKKFRAYKTKAEPVKVKGEVADKNVYRFRRYERSPNPKIGELGPPKVLGLEEGTSIGNNSVCELVVAMFPFEFKGKEGWGARLESVTVLEHVPYERKNVEDINLPPEH